MPVAENMFGPLTIKHLPTPMHYIINIQRNLWTFAIANVHGKNSSWNFHLGYVLKSQYPVKRERYPGFWVISEKYMK